jgi:hypothetical protein
MNHQASQSGVRALNRAMPVTTVTHARKKVAVARMIVLRIVVGP